MKKDSGLCCIFAVLVKALSVRCVGRPHRERTHAHPREAITLQELPNGSGYAYARASTNENPGICSNNTSHGSSELRAGPAPAPSMQMIQIPEPDYYILLQEVMHARQIVHNSQVMQQAAASLEMQAVQSSAYLPLANSQMPALAQPQQNISPVQAVLPHSYPALHNPELVQPMNFPESLQPPPEIPQAAAAYVNPSVISHAYVPIVPTAPVQPHCMVHESTFHPVPQLALDHTRLQPAQDMLKVEADPQPLCSLHPVFPPNQVSLGHVMPEFPSKEKSSSSTYAVFPHRIQKSGIPYVSESETQSNSIKMQAYSVVSHVKNTDIMKVGIFYQSTESSRKSDFVDVTYSNGLDINYIHIVMKPAEQCFPVYINPDTNIIVKEVPQSNTIEGELWPYKPNAVYSVPSEVCKNAPPYLPRPAVFADVDDPAKKLMIVSPFDGACETTPQLWSSSKSGVQSKEYGNYMRICKEMQRSLPIKIEKMGDAHFELDFPAVEKESTNGSETSQLTMQSSSPEHMHPVESSPPEAISSSPEHMHPVESSPPEVISLSPEHMNPVESSSPEQKEGLPAEAPEESPKDMTPPAINNSPPVQDSTVCCMCQKKVDRSECAETPEKSPRPAAKKEPKPPAPKPKNSKNAKKQKQASPPPEKPKPEVKPVMVCIGTQTDPIHEKAPPETRERMVQCTLLPIKVKQKKAEPVEKDSPIKIEGPTLGGKIEYCRKEGENESKKKGKKDAPQRQNLTQVWFPFDDSEQLDNPLAPSSDSSAQSDSSDSGKPPKACEKTERAKTKRYNLRGDRIQRRQ
ncbi:uncharacterized protein NEMAJ01_1410 [Nematocida major]|uniref:uncharacterized protein n=1 Tax=Nematocida major TaxID=1912982 RepID=UPI00200891B3|nr:uncharacterized protein NEMAJ01_1410 [Nematocida major]KAH9386514.1 hypothetical protein NEMAJ01_1410 [Nematocida major]